MGFFRLLRFLLTVQKHADEGNWLYLIVHECECMWEWLLVSVSSLIDWQSVSGVPSSCLKSAGVGFSFPVPLGDTIMRYK